MQQTILLVYLAVGALCVFGAYHFLKSISEKSQEVNRLRDNGDEEAAQAIEKKHLPNESALQGLIIFNNGNVRNMLYMFLLVAWPWIVGMVIHGVLRLRWERRQHTTPPGM